MRIPGSLLLALVAAPAPLLAQDAGGGLFALDPGLSVWTIVVFALVLFVLGKFAWGPILGQVQDRESSIQRSIDEAREMHQEAETLLEEHRKQLADARRQAQEIVSEGREVGERLRREIESKAREEADAILERARAEIGRERDRAMETIRTESVDLALAAAGRILGEKLDAEADRALIQRYLEEMDRPAVEA